MKDKYECKFCKKVFEAYQIAKYCSRSCTAKANYKRLAFDWDDLNYEQKKERLRKSYEEKVIKTEGCWDWKGKIHPTGYILITFNKKKILAHRASWWLHIGEIPEGIHVLHTCDNRKCTNPEHLFLGTEKDNAVDRQKKNRGQKGITHNKCKLTEENVREIKQLLHVGLSCTKLARKFSVTDAAIWFIKEGWTWKHVN